MNVWLVTIGWSYAYGYTQSALDRYATSACEETAPSRRPCRIFALSSNFHTQGVQIPGDSNPFGLPLSTFESQSQRSRSTQIYSFSLLHTPGAEGARCQAAMDRFPQDYVIHNLPLLLLSGLDTRRSPEPDLSGKSHDFLHEGGFRIRVDAPAVSGPLAEQLLQSFCDQDASNVPWHSQAFASRHGRVFKIATVGRVGQRSPKSGRLQKDRHAYKECRFILSPLAKHHRLLIPLASLLLMRMVAHRLRSCFTLLCRP